MNSANHIEQRIYVPPKSVWFGIVAGAAAFTVDGLVNWVISWRTCYIGQGHFLGLSPDGVRVLLAIITISFLAVAVFGGLISYRNWRELSPPEERYAGEARAPAAFLSLGGVILSVILSAGIIWIGLPLIMVDTCMRAH